MPTLREVLQPLAQQQREEEYGELADAEAENRIRTQTYLARISAGAPVLAKMGEHGSLIVDGVEFFVTREDALIKRWVCPNCHKELRHDQYTNFDSDRSAAERIVNFYEQIELHKCQPKDPYSLIESRKMLKAAYGSPAELAGSYALIAIAEILLHMEERHEA